MKHMNKSVTVGMCGFLAWAAGSMAGEPTSLLAGKAPAGLRLAWDRLRSSIPTPRYAPSKSTPTVAGSGTKASNKMSLASVPVPTDRTKFRPPGTFAVFPECRGALALNDLEIGSLRV